MKGIWTLERVGDATVLDMELDKLSREEERRFNAEFSNLLKEGNRHIVIDLSRTSYLASLGIGFLIFMLKNTKKEDCYLAICRADDKVMEVLKTAGVDELFDIVPTREEAISRVLHSG
ncbi:MAG: STAS domain-containing protein [Candidatus Omnitrophica bacterium]|nr:STAS domain-containing protein [Candidatus Omnitrophota bacterium]